MPRWTKAALALCTAAAAASKTAVAAPPSAPEASASAVVLAVVVGNNDSVQLSRHSLQYADDDAAKSYEMLSMVAPDEQLALLTAMDNDTARLFPHLVPKAQPPTRESLLAAAKRLGDQARAALAQGRQVELYFLFAGHGDVSGGRGFLELKDSAFTADDLEQWLSSVPFTHGHVILDSCNSFFVITPRKPGGRRFATPQDVAKSLAKRLPTVGVFLSTSAEAEVYEWSELQSGVFSHAMRSGLMGAADANGDGRVDYPELAAFVDLAASEVKNPLFRPKVFARPPGGNNAVPLLDLRQARGLELNDPGLDPLRLTLRDSAGIRWVDANREAGAALRLRVPTRIAAGLTVERAALAGRDRERFELKDVPPMGAVALASLTTSASTASGRGMAEIFEGLFQKPFGPGALAGYLEAQRTAPIPVFGVAREDGERMQLLLETLKSAPQTGRWVIGGVAAAAGAAFMIPATYELATGTPDPRGAWQRIAAGAGIAAAGVVPQLFPSQEELLYRRFTDALHAPGARMEKVVASTEIELRRIRNRDRTQRIFTAIVAGAAGVLVFSILPVIETYYVTTPADAALMGSVRTTLGLLATGCGAIAVSALVEKSPSERLVDIWDRDPGIQRLPRVGVTLGPGSSMALSLGGSF